MKDTGDVTGLPAMTTTDATTQTRLQLSGAAAFVALPECDHDECPKTGCLVVEKIMHRMFRRRLPQFFDRLALPGWNRIRCGEIKPKTPRTLICELLAAGHKVTAGYHTTGVRGFHEYYVFWKPSTR